MQRRSAVAEDESSCGATLGFEQVDDRREVAVPLSEEEQKILAQMEQSLAADDPNFAERVGKTTLQRTAARACKWSAAGFLVGLALLVGLYSKSTLLGLIGVAVMFASTVAFERNLRRLGRASWHELANAGRAGHPGSSSATQAFHGAKQWLRTRIRRDH